MQSTLCYIPLAPVFMYKKCIYFGVCALVSNLSIPGRWLGSPPYFLVEFLLVLPEDSAIFYCCFKLQPPISGMSGSPPLVLSVDAAQQVACNVYGLSDM